MTNNNLLVKSVSIYVRRWHQKIRNETYHSLKLVVIDDKGNTIKYTLPLAYGHGDFYMKTAQHFMQQKEILCCETDIYWGDVVDVKAKKDLHKI